MTTLICSIVIPVWNGEDVILNSLAAIFEHTDNVLLEVICVNNASEDHSGQLIAEHYPQVKLLNQPVNLGFAGGVNVGIKHAKGDIFVLVNQDCIVQPNWLEPLLAVFGDVNVGIAGITILNADKTINHAGAILEKPYAKGTHLTEPQKDTPSPVDYVTGAVFAIHRRVWDTIGSFDEDFYPAYFEETDYCYRARYHNFEIVYVPQPMAIHLRSNKAWQENPVKHQIEQYRSRYRFVIKHFDADTLAGFFRLEMQDIETNRYFEHRVGRIVAARHILRDLPKIIHRRQTDLGEVDDVSMVRQIQVGFREVLRYAFVQLQRMYEKPLYPEENTDIEIELQTLQQQEYSLLTRIYFRSPTDTTPESKWQRFTRLFVKRVVSFISGRDYVLLAELNTVHVARMDKMNKLCRQIEGRLKVMEVINQYDY